MRLRLTSAIWLIVGIILASTHHYFKHVDAIKPIVAAVLAVLLWPLLLLGVNLHIH